MALELRPFDVSVSIVLPSTTLLGQAGLAERVDATPPTVSVTNDVRCVWSFSLWLRSDALTLAQEHLDAFFLTGDTSCLRCVDHFLLAIVHLVYARTDAQVKLFQKSAKVSAHFAVDEAALWRVVRRAVEAKYVAFSPSRIGIAEQGHRWPKSEYPVGLDMCVD